MAFDFQQWARENLTPGNAAPQQPSYQQPSQPAWMGGMQNYYNQIAQVNQQMQQEDDRSAFSLDKGTDRLFNGRYRNANQADTLAIEAGRIGEWWNNVPGQIAGAFGGDQAKEDWTFNAGDFDLSNGFQLDQEGKQIRNFAASLPGMIVGGLFEGANKGYEAITGAPVQEYREREGGGYEIADYTLDASQRAAAGVDAVIDVAGTFTGGAGRVAGTVGKLGVKAAGKALKEGASEAAEQSLRQAQRGFKAADMFDNMSKGMIERAWTAGGGSAPKGAIGQTAFDIADEASEEFIQSYADDIRNKTLDEGSLDRAMTGAAWGAVGGGLMSGGARLANHFMGSSSESGSDNTSPDNEAYTPHEPWAALRMINPAADRMNSAGRQTIQDKLTDNRYATGSGIYKHTGSDDTLDFDSLRVGTENIEQTFYQNERSQQKLAHSFGTDVESLHNIFRLESEQEKADALNGLIANKNVQVAVGRNPDTKNGGFYMDLDSVVPGQSFVMHPIAFAITGSDIDGDTSSVYFDPRNEAPGSREYDESYSLNANGYVSEMLLNSEGQSNVDWWYAGINDNVKANEKAIIKSFEELLAPYSASEIEGKTPARYFADKFNKIVNSDYGNANTRNNDLSALFIELNSVITDLRNHAIDNDGDGVADGVDPSSLPEARNVVNSVLSSITGNEETIISNFCTYHLSLIEQEMLKGATDEQRAEYERLQEEEGDASQYSDMYARGTLGSNTKVFQMTRNLGLLTYVTTKEGNAPYRQYGQLYYMIKSVPAFREAVVGMASERGSEGIFTSLVRASFRMQAAGISPSSAIESLCDDLMLTEVRVRSGLSAQRVLTNDEVQNLEEVFVEVQKKYSKLYNDAKKQFTQRGWQIDQDSPYKNSLDGVSDPGFARMFNKLFKSVMLKDVIDISKMPSKYQTYTWGGLVEELAKESYRSFSNEVLAPIVDNNSTKNLLGLVNRCVANYNSEVKAVEESLKNALGGIDTTGIIERYKANGNTLDPSDVPAMLMLTDAFHMFIDPEIATIELNLLDPDALLQTEVGMKLFEGSVDEKLNVIVSGSLIGQFRSLVNDLRSENDNLRINAIYKLQRISETSFVHAAIAADILEGKTDVLDWATDLNLSLDDKVKQFNQAIGSSFPLENFVVDALKTDGGDFDISGLSERVRKGSDAISNFERMKYDKIIDEVNSFESMLANEVNVDDDVMSYLNERCTDIITNPNMDIVAMKIYAAITVDNKFVEKAVNTNAEVWAYMMNQIGVNGNLVSHIDSVSSMRYGKMSLNDWCSSRYHILSCFSDPNYECEVYDHDNQCRVIMTQESLFQSVDPTYKQGDRITKDLVVKVLKAYPQIAGYICEGGVMGSVTDGVAGATPGRYKGIADDFATWRKKQGSREIKPGNEDVLVKAQIERNIKVTRAWLHNQSWFHQLLTLSLGDNTLEGEIDMKALNTDVRLKEEQLVNYFYNRACHADSWSRFQQAHERGTLMTGMLADLWKIVSVTNEQLPLRLSIGQSLSNVETQMILSALGNMRVANWLKEDGFDITDVSISDPEGNFSGIINATEEGIKQSVDLTMKTTEMICYMATDGALADIDASFAGVYGESEAIKNALKREIKKQNPQINESQVDALADEKFAEACRNVNTKAYSEDTKNLILTMADFESEESLRSKMTSLYSEDPELLKNIDGDIESVFSTPAGEARDSSIQNLIHNTNANVVRNNLRKISQYNTAPINSNMFELQKEILDQMDAGVSKFTEEMRRRNVGMFPSDLTQIDDYMSGVNHDLPKLGFASETKQSAVTNMIVADQAAGNPVRVGINGGMGKKTYGIGYLSENYVNQDDSSNMDLAYSIPIQFASILLDNQGSYDNMRVLDSSGAMHVVGSNEFYNWAGTVDPSEDVQLFDPFENPHGLSTYNSIVPAIQSNSRYHRLSGIIGSINDYCQEAMVLKLKKNFKAIDEIVTERRDGTPESRVVQLDQETISDPSKSFEACNSMFRDFRREFSNALYNEFKPGGSMDGLKYSDDQAMILAQAMTPGIEVTFVRDGRVEHAMIDANCFFGQDAQIKFQERLQEIIEPNVIGQETVVEPVTITSFKVYIASLEEISDRIGNAVSRKRADNNGQISKETSERVALHSMNDWSDYSANLNSGSVESVIGSVTPLGYMRNGTLVTPDSPTESQWLYDDIWDGGYGSKVGTSIFITTKQPNMYNDAKDQYQVMASLAQELTGGSFPVVVKGYVHDNTAASSLSNMQDQLRQQLLTINQAGDGWFGIVVVTDGSKAKEAIDYAAPRKMTVLFSEDAWLEGSGFARSFSNSQINTQKFGKFYRVNTGARSAFDIIGNRPKSSWHDEFSDDIRMAVVVDSDVINLGDAEIAATEEMADVRTRSDKSKSFPLSDYFSGKANNLRKDFVTRNDAARLLNMVAVKGSDGSWIPATEIYDDNGAIVVDENGTIVDPWIRTGFDFNANYTNRTKQSKMKIKELIVDYLVELSSKPEGSTDYRSENPKKGSCGAIVTNGVKFAPVLYPDTFPKNVYYSDIWIADGDVHVAFSGDTRMFEPGEEGSTKWSLMGETFKGMISRFRGSFIPKVGSRNVHFLVSSDTEGSRVSGKEELLLKDALYYGSRIKYQDEGYGSGAPHTKGLSLFFDGNDFSEQVKKWPAEDRRKLINATDRNFWSRVGVDLRISDSDQVNLDVHNMILACQLCNMNPMYLFSAYRLESTDGPYGDPDASKRIVYHNKGVDYHMVFKDFSADQMLRIYHAMDQTFCPDGVSDPDVGRKHFMLDQHGRTYVQIRNGEYAWLPVRYGPHRILGDTTNEAIASGQASVSRQHQGRRAQDNGFLSQEIMDAIDYEDFVLGNYEYNLDKIRSQMEDRRSRKVKYDESSIPEDIKIASTSRYGSMREIRRMAKVREMFGNMFSIPRPIYSGNKVDGNGQPATIEPGSPEEAEIDAAYNRFLNALNYKVDPDSPFRKTMSKQQVFFLAMLNDGASYTTPETWGIRYTSLVKAIDTMADNLKSGEPIPIKCQFDNSRNLNNRYSIPLITPEMVDWIWEGSYHVRQSFGNDKQSFIDRMRSEQTKAESIIKTIDGTKGEQTSRKIELTDLARAARMQWNDVSTVLPLWEDISFEQLFKDEQNLGALLGSGENFNDDQKALYKQLCDMNDEKLVQIRNYLERLGYKELDVAGVDGGKVAYSKVDDAKFVTRVLGNAAELSKVMAICNPAITIANISDRALHQGIMNAAMQIGHKFRMGPYASAHWANQNIVRASINNELAIELYAAYRTAAFSGDEMEFIANAQSAEQIRAWLDDRKKTMPKLQKVTERLYELSSGGNKFLKGQMRNFVNRFVMFAEEEGMEFYFEDSGLTDTDGNPLTNIEAKLASPNGFADFFLECIGAKGPTASYSIAMKAMNSAKQGDMAQRNAIGVVLGHVFRKVPMSKFIMTTGISRFPGYGINVTNRMLNWVLPMSSINYVFTEYLSKTKLGQELGIEETQIHRSLKEAILVDITKMGLGAVAVVLANCAGLLEPPDDERKWGNTDEWLLAGMRIGESWWVEDMLGMALPLACFYKACASGKPRIDILTNGIASACYSNPVIRCSDIASFLVNPGESLISDYNEDVIQFQNAKGGVSYAAYIQSNAFTLGLSWLSQFITPSIVRDIYQSWPQFEKSYKKVYETNASGTLTEDGANGKQVYTTYSDAMIRKMTRNNPVWGFLFSAMHGFQGTSYWGPSMPDTIYYDDAQLESADAYSVKGSDGEERVVKIANIIGILQSYDSMEELAETGFFLDRETLEAVAQQVWDNYHEADEWYYGLQSSGQLDYYVLGNGDWSAGQQAAADIKLQWQGMKQYWYDFYYQKLKDTAISGNVQMYNRYNTTYGRDVYGNVYATGIQRSPLDFLPVTMAPGSISNPENTAGYEGDWNTLSAVTGDAMQQRALIPAGEINRDLGDFEAWSGDGNGNTYSKQYQNIYGKVGDTSKTTTNYPRSTGGSGGSGGSGSGGGGGSRGGSYAPNAYAPSVSLPRANAGRVMNTDRLVNPNYDYLRPDFETKGSREAYRRSDI